MAAGRYNLLSTVWYGREGGGGGMINVFLANILLSVCHFLDGVQLTSQDVAGSPYKFPPVPVLHSTPPTHNGIAKCWGKHSIVVGSEKEPADPEETQSPQHVEATVALSVDGSCLWWPLQIMVDVNTKVLRMSQFASCLRCSLPFLFGCFRRCWPQALWLHQTTKSKTRPQLARSSPLRYTVDKLPGKYY